VLFVTIGYATAYQHLFRPKIFFRFYPRDVVSVVIAVVTWLGGWLAGCHTPVLYQNG